MAVQTTEEFKSAGSTSYTTAIEKLKDTDLKVRIGGALQTYVASSPGSGQYTVTNNPTTIVLGTAASAEVHIYRETDVNSAAAVFAPGSSIRAADLNAIHDMARFAAVEHRNKIITADIKEGQITSTEIKNDSIVNEDINTSANIDNSKLADGLLKAGLTINSDNIVNGSIVDADISSSANIEGTKLKNDSVTLAKLGNGPLPTDITINSDNIVNGSIVDADINSNASISHSKLNLNIVDSDVNSGANIAGTKLANDSVPLTKLGGGALPTDITVAASNIVDGTIGNIEINNAAAIEFTKLETGNLPSQITVNSSNIVNGSIVDEDINASANIAGTKLANDSVPLTKLGGGALPTDITVASTNIVDGTIVDADINASANINGAKLANDSVPLTKFGAGALPTDITVASANVVNGTLVNADINSSADIEGSKLLNNSVSLDKLGPGELPTDITVKNANIITGTLDGRYYTETELDAGKLDNRYFTETELTNGALDGRYYTETEAEARFLRQDSSETIASGATWSNSDAFVATTAAINARIIDLIDEVGGFTAIANQTSFPATNPQGATGQAAILSIQATTATLTPSGTTVTIPNGAGTGNTVTITGVPTAIPQNFGFLVESTSTTHTYNFHRLVPIATQVNTVAQNITNIVNAGANVADINNFADIYIIAANQPTTRNDGSALQEGDLWYDTSNDNLLVYTGSAFAIITPNQTVLDNVATVSGAITYSEDLGLITNPVATGTSNGSLDIVADVLEDEIEFTVTVSNGKYFIDGTEAPALQLYKGWTYTFDVSDSSVGGHPFRFKSGSNAYTTNVVVTGTAGNAGAKVQIVIPESQPTSFIYYCTNHSGMGNSITVKDDPLKTISDNVTEILAAANNFSNINAVQANASNINAAVANASNINAAVANASNINAAVSNASNITAVAGNNTNITAVANNATNINAVKNNATNINAVNANKSNIDTVAGNNTNVTTVAGKATEIARLGTADAVSDMNTLGTTAIVNDMDTLADIASDITTVANNDTNVSTVAGISGNVTTVAGISSNVTAVAGNATNINAVKNNATNINAVNANKTNIDAVAANNANITAVKNNETNINAVKNNATNINTVAGINANVSTVAGISANVTSVANNASNINSAVSNAANINAAVANATNINSVVSNATNINTTANNIADVNNFANRYRIGSTNPTTSLDVGDLFFNTSANELRIYNGTQWQGGVTATGNLSQVSGSVFTGDNRYNDNVKAKFGTDSDLQIFHDSNHSLINASGAGNLKLQDQGNTKLEITSTGLSATGNIVVSGTVDGRDVAADGSKLDGIEVGATADQSNSEIKTAYEANSNTNAFTDALLSKLNGIEAGATGDQTVAEIVAAIAGQTIAPNAITTTNLTLDFGTL